MIGERVRRGRRGGKGYPLVRVTVAAALAMILPLAVTVVTILLMNARSATRQEVGAAFELASAFLEDHRTSVSMSSDPMVAATALATQIDRLRHVRGEIRREDGVILRTVPPSGDPDGAPGWFTQVIAGENHLSEIPIIRYPNLLGAVRITSDYRDESTEVWNDFRAILPSIGVAGTLAVVLSIGIVFLVKRRIHDCAEGLDRIRAGELSARVRPQMIAEFAVLAEGINDLAEHLLREREENRHLQERLMTLSEVERQRIASDLHDGMGPCLFALGAALEDARSLARDTPGPESARLCAALDTAGNHLLTLRRTTRSTIYHLRPLISAGSGLDEILGEFAASFYDVAPDVRVTVEVARNADRDFRDGVEVAVHRFVQESALNAVRHGGATVIAITAWLSREGTSDLVVRLSDNGAGPRVDAVPHHGQVGILDRVRALGGRYLPPVRAEEGVRTEIRIPC